MSDPIKAGVEQINGNRPYCPKCNELARLLLECRDALPAISLSSAKLHNVSLSLADRIEDALQPWKIEKDLAIINARRIRPKGIQGS